MKSEARQRMATRLGVDPSEVPTESKALRVALARVPKRRIAPKAKEGTKRGRRSA